MNKCEFCVNAANDGFTLVLSNEDCMLDDEEYFVYLSNNKMTLMESDDMGASVYDELIINYCPMCGRKLI